MTVKELNERYARLGEMAEELKKIRAELRYDELHCREQSGTFDNRIHEAETLLAGLAYECMLDEEYFTDKEA